jgi:hypothetical protein
LAESRGFRLVLLHDRIVTIDPRVGNGTAAVHVSQARKSVGSSDVRAGEKGLAKLTRSEQKENIVCTPPLDTVMTSGSSSPSQPNLQDADELEAAVDQAIAACDGNLRATIRALILANDFLESEVSELMKAVSHAYVRGRFQSYSG